ncbi:MAG: transposase [Proteobacteria bacterium]|nr:transposase [Pseudomonadota bacterium]
MDLGYASLKLLSSCDRYGVSYVLRLKENWKPKVLHVARGSVSRTFAPGTDLDLLLQREVLKLDGKVIDADVELGHGSRVVGARLVGVSTPKGYCFYLTNLAPDVAPRAVADLYRVRWEIELDNKLDKSCLRLDDIGAKTGSLRCVPWCTPRWSLRSSFACLRTITAAGGALLAAGPSGRSRRCIHKPSRVWSPSPPLPLAGPLSSPAARPTSSGVASPSYSTARPTPTGGAAPPSSTKCAVGASPQVSPNGSVLPTLRLTDHAWETMLLRASTAESGLRGSPCSVSIRSAKHSMMADAATWSAKSTCASGRSFAAVAPFSMGRHCFLRRSTTHRCPFGAGTIRSGALFHWLGACSRSASAARKCGRFTVARSRARVSEYQLCLRMCAAVFFHAWTSTYSCVRRSRLG